MSKRKRVRVDAKQCLADLTRRVVRVLIGMSDQWNQCNDVADLMGIRDTRRLYDILDTLYALGCLHKKGKHHYQWCGRPTLESLPSLPESHEQTIALATQQVVRFFRRQPRQRVWKGRDVKLVMQWSLRPRILYDVLSVFRGIGLVSPRHDIGVFAFEWSPDAVLPLVSESKTECKTNDEDTPPVCFILDSPSYPPPMDMPDFEALLTNK